MESNKVTVTRFAKVTVTYNTNICLSLRFKQKNYEKYSANKPP